MPGPVKTLSFLGADVNTNHRWLNLDLGLRTKFLLSLVLTTVGLSFTTLLAVRHATLNHVQQEIEADTNNSQLTFQVLLHQHEIELRRKADLLATVAAMTDDHDAALQESADNILENEDRSLVLFADNKHKITARTTNPQFSSDAAEKLLGESLAKKKTADWWYVNGTLYQVVLQPIDRRLDADSAAAGTVIVGRAIDYAAVHDLGRIAASQVAFAYDSDVVASTFNPLTENELKRNLQKLSAAREIEIGDERFFARPQELNAGSAHRASLLILKSYRGETAFLESLNRLHFSLGLAAVAIGTLLAFYFSDTFTRPLATLDRGVHALEQGDFTFPLEAQGGDEVARVTRAFDHMRVTLKHNEEQKQQLQDELRQSQKMDALGRLAGGVAHDFNNLLTVIKGHSDLLVERLSATDPLANSGRQIQKASDRAASLTRQMLAFSRRQALQPTVLDLNALVLDMSKLLKRLIHEDVEFTVRSGESLGKIKADAGQIEQVILNLVVNACDAMPTGGKLTIETRTVNGTPDLPLDCSKETSSHYVLMTVTDTGHGMSDETKARIFEPFFTTKAKDKGTGLGLATVYGVVKQSGGCIQVDSAPGNGTTFRIYLPRVEDAVDTPQVEKLTPVRMPANETVLLVEDEPGVRSLACEFLSSAGYKVLIAPDGETALEIAKRRDEQIQLLITDVVMPVMGGAELANRLRERTPDLRIIYMSGYLEENEGDSRFFEDAMFLQKPFSRESLLQTARAALNSLSAVSVA